MHLIAPGKNRRKWNVRLRNHDGRTVTIPGDTDKGNANRIGLRLDMLVRAKLNGDPPPPELKQWLDNMSKKLSQRLIALGLVEPRRFERHRGLIEKADEFEKVLAARKTNAPKYAKMQANRLKAIFTKMGATTFSDLTEDAVAQTIQSLPLATSTKRHYILTCKDFSKWASKALGMRNPLEDLKPPGQYVNPVHERIPLTVEQFKSLMAHLDGAKREKHQRTEWNALDRKLAYWTAVKTAFRAAELASLRVRSLALDATPPQVLIRASDAKNKTKASVPIPADLAAALRDYIKGRDPDEVLFPMPSIGNGLLNAFRRDLDAAKIKWDWGKDDPQVIDFHSLRTTAITWWLDVDGLSAKRVQILARLKTLALVATYSRNMKLDEFGWLNNGPKLVPTNPETT